MKQTFLYIFLIYLVLNTVSLAQSHQKSTCTPTNHQNNSANQTTIQTQNSSTKPKPTDQTEKDEKGKQQLTLFEDCYLSLTAILAIFTIVLAITSFYQYRHSKEHSEMELRAYVDLVFNNLIEQDLSLDRNYEFHCFIKNTGQTPAYNVIVCSKVGVMPIPYSEDFKFTLDKIDNGSMTVIGPQQSTTIFPTAVGPPYDLAVIYEIKNPGARKLCLYGRVDYKDVFGHQRFTNFSYYVIWGDKGDPILMSTSQHNDAT